MLINLRNALMAGKRLPYDAEVEYLESTGTQWIDTGIVVSNPSTVSVSVTRVSGNFNFGFAHANATAGTWLGTRTSLSKAYFKNYYATVNVPNIWQQLRWDGSSGLYADGELVGAASAGVGADAIGATSWPIFAMHEFNGGGVSQYSSCQISSVQIEVSGTLVRDYIPVRKGTVGYLYDRVSGKLFGNAGTGAFAYGNDLKYPIPAE